MRRVDNVDRGQSMWPLDNPTFAVTTGNGPLEYQSILLCKSIRRQYPDAQIINFIPSSSVEDIGQKSKRFFEKETTILTGEIPIQEYVISAKLKAFEEAAKRTDYEHIIMLDTDTVVISPIELPNRESELYAKPVDVGAQYWGSQEAISDWQNLYTYFGVEFPTKKVKSTIDKRAILPYWNAGVVITTDDSIPSRLLEMTKKIYNEGFVNGEEDYFLDQLALAILAETYQFSRLWELHNYPMNARLTCPSSVQVLHYDDMQHLRRIPNSKIRRKLRSLGLKPENIELTNIRENILNIIYNHSGKYLSYHQKLRLATVLSD